MLGVEKSFCLGYSDFFRKGLGEKINKKFVNMRPGEHKIEINLDPKILKNIWIMNYSGI